MTQVVIKKQVTVEETIDVAFPLYLQKFNSYEATSSDEWLRIDEEGQTVTYTKKEDGKEVDWQVEIEVTELTEIGWMLKYYTASSPMKFCAAEDEFNAAFKKARSK